jgi:hypothetical protein
VADGDFPPIKQGFARFFRKKTKINLKIENARIVAWLDGEFKSHLHFTGM